MNRFSKTSITAIFSVAVIFLIIGAIGCVTPRHIEEVRADISRLEASNDNTEYLIARMDSIVSAGAEADNRLRSNVSMTMDELQQQISALLDNYNELLNKLNRIEQQGNVIKVPPTSSPGAQIEPKTGGSGSPDINPIRPAYDCDSTYDESFILVRRGEYEQAIQGFNTYMENCPDHENVEHAYFWIGESYYSMEKYTEAVDQFTKLLNDFKGSTKIGSALYKLGRSQQELGKKADAKTTFQRLIDEHPETLEATQAKERLKDLG